MTLDHLSYSSISLYLDCPAAWQRKYLLKEPTRSTPALVFGTAVHAFIEAQVARQTLAWNAGQAVEAQPLAETWSTHWQAALERDTETLTWNGDTPEQHYNEGLRLLGYPDIAALINGLTARCDDQGAMIERKVELRVPGVGIPIIGYIDLVTADSVPCDIKTAGRAWTQTQASDSLQTLFYLAALNQAGQHWHDWRFRHLVLVKTKTPQAQIIEHRHTAREIFFLFKLIQGVWDAIQKASFPLNPTSWKCDPKYCDFWANCRGRYA